MQIKRMEKCTALDLSAMIIIAADWRTSYKSKSNGYAQISGKVTFIH